MGFLLFDKLNVVPDAS